MDYNNIYKNNENVFGKDPEKILVEYSSLIPKDKHVLDIGAGQGRNTRYLSKLGYFVDAIDTSEISIQKLESIKETENHNIKINKVDYNNFTGEEKYSAILLFGIIQILDWDEIYILREKVSNWLENGGMLFITAFTISDDSLRSIISTSKRIGENSYRKPDGENRTYFESGEIKELFEEYKTVHYWEGLGPKHRHGNNPIERHSMVEAVFQK